MTACVLVCLFVGKLDIKLSNQDCQHLIDNMAQNSLWCLIDASPCQPSRVDARSRSSLKVAARNDSDDIAKLGPRLKATQKAGLCRGGELSRSASTINCVVCTLLPVACPQVRVSVGGDGSSAFLSTNLLPPPPRTGLRLWGFGQSHRNSPPSPHARSTKLAYSVARRIKTGHAVDKSDFGECAVTTP
jgi:hypothetical protein